MKNKKIIIAAAVALAAVVCAAVLIIVGAAGGKDKDDNKFYVNLVEKYVSDTVRANVVVPDRAADAGFSFDKTEVNPKAYEKFTLTDEEAKEMNRLVGSSAWHLATEMEFSDVGAKEYFEDIINGSGLGIGYNPEKTYYLLCAKGESCISTKELSPATSCEIALYDIEAKAFYYIRFDV